MGSGWGGAGSEGDRGYRILSQTSPGKAGWSVGELGSGSRGGGRGGGHEVRGSRGIGNRGIGLGIGGDRGGAGLGRSGGRRIGGDGVGVGIGGDPGSGAQNIQSKFRGRSRVQKLVLLYNTTVC